MKRIISLIIAVLMLCALCVPAFAEVFSDGQTIPGGSYNDINIQENARVTINSEVTLSLFVLNENSALVIESDGFLSGTGVGFSLIGSGQKIEIEEGGGLKIVFTAMAMAKRFADLLNNSGITCSCTGNTVQAGAPPCSHANKTTTTTTATDTDITTTVTTKTTVTTTNTTTCDDCGKTLSTDVSTDTSETTETTVTKDPPATASALSEGNMTVVLCIACAVVFGLGGFFLGRKKKPALANSNDEE